jgi:N-acetylglucosamine kinase-like BadF-type ATPase
MKIWNTVEDVLADFEADRPKPPLPKPTAAVKGQQRFAASNQPTKAVFDAATRGNDAAIERLEETMEQRRQKQMAKELAEYNAEGSAWHSMVHWWQSVERAQERLRALNGEVPEKGIYSPVARFEREVKEGR